MPRVAGVEVDEPVTVLSPTLTDEETLMRLVWERSPDVAAARGEALVVESEVVRAGLLPNPELTVDVGSLPLAGAPSEVSSPWTQGPSVGLGVEWVVEVDKRGARLRHARSQVELARQEAAAVAYDRFFEVLQVLAKLALAELEAGMFTGLVRESQSLLDLQKKRLGAGDIPPTEVARAELEHARLVAQQGTALSEQLEALGSCAQLLGIRCPTFGDTARAWVDAMLAFPLPRGWDDAFAERHPELVELAAREKVARALTRLSEAEGVPDIGLRAGYTWDTFPGNHAHTASVGVTVPLMVSRKGQAEAAAATAEMMRIDAVRRARKETAASAIEVAHRRLELARTRSAQLGTALEQGEALIATMTQGLGRGAGNLADILIARRTQQEVALDRLAIEALALDAVFDARREAGLAPSIPAVGPRR